MIEKPATVEVGGWWITATAGDAPFRVERLVGDGDTLIAIHSDGHGEPSSPRGHVHIGDRLLPTEILPVSRAT